MKTTDATMLTFLDMQRQRRRHELITSVIYHVCVGALGLIMLYPILWMFACSLKTPEEMWKTDIFSLIPKQFLFTNYINGWKGFGGVTFATFFKNSFMYAGLGTVAAVISSALVAYGFARIPFAGSRIWFTIMMLTLMLPYQVLMVPQYIVFAKLGWLNSLKPLLIPRCFGNVFFIFLMIQFIRGIPVELDHAAEIDGCGKGAIFFRIILPLIQPALITSMIFSFYWTWEDFLGPLIYMSDPKRYTVSLALRAFSDPSGLTDWGAIFAMLSLSLVPVFILFITCQKYIVEGISTTGLKG